MTRFNNFFDQSLITEKVTKKEIDQALKNDKILIGVEFEFILDDFTKENAEYEAAQTAYDAFEEDVKEAQKQYEELQDELWEMHQSIEKLRGKLDKAELKLELAQEKGDRNDIKKWESTVKVLEDDLQDKENAYEERQDTYLDDIDWPKMGDDYIEYMNNTGQYVGNYNIFSIVAEHGRMPEEPINYEDTSIPENIERFMESEGILKAAPFKNYKIGMYGEVKQKVGSDLWAIENDDSLSMGGIEVKSPPMELPKFIKMFPDLLKWISKYGYTDRTTGMHVNLSVKGVNDLQGKIDILKMILFLDEGFIWKAFDERLNNVHVHSVKDKLKQDVILDDKDIRKIFNRKKMLVRFMAEHQDAINFQNIHTGRIEYRYLGGTNYEKKFDKLRSSIGQFAYNLSLGYDKDFKRKEYIKKLSRIFNKMELFEYGYMIEKLKDAEMYVILSDDKRKIERLLKEWEKNYNQLKSKYTIDKNTKRLLYNNYYYKNSIEEQMRNILKKRVSTPAFHDLERHLF